ncbi:MAG TPA: glycosyltransferase family 4 protein [Candidatus Binataceae bacterium]|nr:glycosyltransferase family 4 protein [Candidatus Binataceae bacterium]
MIGGTLYQTEGSQYDLEDLRRLAANLGLEGRVGFTGFVDEPAAAMRALDVVVHASTQPEPFGLVIAEAMACGRAVVVSGGGGAAELVRPGEDALVHEAGRASALAERIGELARDSALGARAEQSARQRFARAARGSTSADLPPALGQGRPARGQHLSAGIVTAGLETVVATFVRFKRRTPSGVRAVLCGPGARRLAENSD